MNSDKSEEIQNYKFIIWIVFQIIIVILFVILLISYRRETKIYEKEVIKYVFYKNIKFL